MKTRIFSVLLLAALTGAAHATLYTYNFSTGFNNAGVIPDGNVTGWSDTRNVPNSFTLGLNDTSQIVDVNVRLNVTGGYNGDLYGYLVHSSGFAVLLNRVGKTSGDAFGYGDAGMNVTFNDQTAETIDIHSYQTVGGYNASFITGGAQWRPDGRNVDPATVLDSDSRTALLTSFNPTTADGNWTLFLADMAGGDVSTVASWGLDISVVPEPVTVALGAFGLLLGGAQILRWRRSRVAR
ncbi:MAG: PEP-CTERM sorting domain-containing protein [Pedosphaera sp.]|nr:PEP-CTERM sorting domain-containing protein [Pedosphaera sp.]